MQIFILLYKVTVLKSNMEFVTKIWSFLGYIFSFFYETFNVVKKAIMLPERPKSRNQVIFVKILICFHVSLSITCLKIYNLWGYYFFHFNINLKILLVDHTKSRGTVKFISRLVFSSFLLNTFKSCL